MTRKKKVSKPIPTPVLVVYDDGQGFWNWTAIGVGHAELASMVLDIARDALAKAGKEQQS